MQRTPARTLSKLIEQEADQLIHHKTLSGIVKAADGLERLRKLRETFFWLNVIVGGEDDCWPWIGLSFKKQKGMLPYGRVTIFGYHTTAHRASYLLRHGHIPEDMLVCHSCDNPPCVNPKHLFLGDSMANMQDCASKGRVVIVPQRGEAHGGCKLTRNDVLKIRQLRSSGESLVSLAVKFGTTMQNVHLIAQRKNWKWLNDDGTTKIC